MTFTMQNPQRLVGEVAFDQQGDEIGEIEAIYLDHDTDQPEWAAVRAGDDVLRLVPLAGATEFEGGVEVAVDGDSVRSAPSPGSSLPDEISEELEDELYAHYRGEGAATAWSQASDEGAALARAAGDRAEQVASTAVDEGRSVAASAVDESRRVAATAADESRRVASSATQQLGAVADSARDQAAVVRQEVSSQARALVGETRTQLQDQAETQLARLAETLRRYGSEARALGEGRPSESGAVGDCVRQAAERLTTLAEEIEARGPQGVLDELRQLARRRPGAFVAGAAIAGFGIGAALRNLGDDAESHDEPEEDERGGPRQLTTGAGTRTGGRRTR